MSSTNRPSDWTVPQWHADFGDPIVEFEQLQLLAVTLSETVPNIGLTLDTSEPGSMELHVDLPNGDHAEVHSVPQLKGRPGRRLAIFVSPGTQEEIEQYADSIDAAVAFFANYS